MFSSLQVTQAMTLLTEYNERLSQELKDRKKVDKMIADFLAAQKDMLAQAEERLELYRYVSQGQLLLTNRIRFNFALTGISLCSDKLDKVNSVKDDLQSHIQSLPDLTKLPDVTSGGLPPLPSAGDLFTAR